MKHSAVFLAAFFLLTALVTPAADAGETHVEILAGSHFSTLSPIANNFTLGVRGGYRFSDAWAVEGTLSRVDFADVHAPFVHLEAEATHLDFSIKWFITPHKKYQLYLYGGPGMSFYDMRINHVGLFSVDNSFAWHIGTGVSVPLSERMFFRPDVRVRWDSSVVAGNADVEVALGIGWRFGHSR